MKESEFGSILFETARKIFEEAAFAFVDPGEDDAAGDGDMLAVAVEFDGPFCGTMAMSAPSSLAVVFAANMLGVDEDDPEAGTKSSDAMKELLNMICGNFLPAAAGPGPEFRISAPEMIAHDEFAALENGGGVVARASVEMQPVVVAFEIRK